ncbi:hypothetical protein R5H30_16100 [Sulfitobacter sp. D35]|uniref:hypothetical protein n=1 Tax=Sulfitobacter sp. D35 TaxID=3083252 RepID=UPI00296EA1D7|nr:hypothetical protein [Sulfitobacter sp. D35]MDW4499516.1 hypothetical protein [Sulfitobacter sp. D35]
MADSYTRFQRRVAELTRKHRALAEGYTPLIGPDGLIELRPTRARHGVPVRAILLTALCFVAFKSFMLASLGPLTYQERVEALQQGTVVERAGAWIMQVDPATEKLGSLMR